MGYIKHDAIIVTSFKSEHADEARKEAIGIGLITTPLVKSEMNGYVTFLIVPDGSKEGWADSDKGEQQRAQWKAWATSNAGRLFIDWVHVEYAGDDGDDTKIADHSKAL
jgi:hypothetical protein